MWPFRRGLDWLAKKLGYVEQRVNGLRSDLTDLVGRVQQLEERDSKPEKTELRLQAEKRLEAIRAKHCPCQCESCGGRWLEHRPEECSCRATRRSLVDLALRPSNDRAAYWPVPGQAYRMAKQGHGTEKLRAALGVRQDHRTAERCIVLSDPERDEYLLVFEGFEDDDLEDEVAAPPKPRPCGCTDPMQICVQCDVRARS